MELISIRLIMVISFLGVFFSSSNMIKFNAACNPRDREALINFKHNLNDSYSNALSSWVGNDCCQWNGVICDKNKIESDVVQLQLSDFMLSGELNSSLLELKHLYHLDLSENQFMGNQIPAFFGSLHNLRYLDLLGSGFTGKVPPQLGNLSSLHYLDLSFNNLEWEIPRTLGNLCNLEVLRLHYNKLQGEILSRLFTNSSICSVNKLKLLRLEYNYLLSGRLPDELGSLENLEELFLAGNSFSGSIPTSLGRLSSLRELDLRDNNLNGSLPESFGNLSSLEELHISNNMLEGDVIEAHFANLKKLVMLDISSMVLNVSCDWIPPFQLIQAQLLNCSVGHRFPEWLRTQIDLVRVDISNSGISGSVPSWFWKMTSQLYYLNISHNQFEGDLSNVLLKSLMGGEIYLSSNRFTGNLPLISSRVDTLDLSKNDLSGSIDGLVCNSTKDLNSLRVLDLSENNLSGQLPDCWFYWTSMVQISLQNNNITGKIPSSIGYLGQLYELHLQKNAFYGELPYSLKNCTELRVLDLGENRLTGCVPTWIGERLNVLRLRSNKFHGRIPRELCNLSKLQILDLGHNNLSGIIPRCFSKFTAMTSERFTDFMNFSQVNNKSGIELEVKGQELVYGLSLLDLVFYIDLSNNNLYGEVPEEITYLRGLQILNLAENHFTGKIPKRIGHLNSLESLDLSNNRLSGSIPQSMANLTFISYLNLSYNNLSGEIPSSTQLQSFSELSYIGNHDLCGRPLNNCNEDEQPPRKAPNGDGEGSLEDNEDEDWIEMKWFYMGLPLGLVVGFWCLWGVLLVKKTWRYAYFRFLDDIIYNLCTCLKQKKK